MSKKYAIELTEAEAAWLANEVSEHFFWGAVEIHDYEHFSPMVSIFQALMAAGLPEPERVAVREQREREAREAEAAK